MTSATVRPAQRTANVLVDANHRKSRKLEGTAGHRPARSRIAIFTRRSRVVVENTAAKRFESTKSEAVNETRKDDGARMLRLRNFNGNSRRKQFRAISRRPSITRKFQLCEMGRNTPRYRLISRQRVFGRVDARVFPLCGSRFSRKPRFDVRDTFTRLLIRSPCIGRRLLDKLSRTRSCANARMKLRL